MRNYPTDCRPDVPGGTHIIASSPQTWLSRKQLMCNLDIHFVREIWMYSTPQRMKAITS